MNATGAAAADEGAEGRSTMGQTLRRLVFSYHRSARDRSPLLPSKSESALRNTIVSSRA